jgi:hypothetical protein
MSFQTVIIQTDQTADSFRSVCNLAPLKLPALNNFLDYISGVCGGNYSAKFTFYTGAVQATGLITSTGAATAGETMVVAGVTFTARASGATGNEYNLSATVGTQAANMAAAINASTNLAGIVTATSALGVVTLTAVVPGVMGNGLSLSDATTNVAVTAFASGTNGTSYVIDQL